MTEARDLVTRETDGGVVVQDPHNDRELTVTIQGSTALVTGGSAGPLEVPLRKRGGGFEVAEESGGEIGVESAEDFWACMSGCWDPAAGDEDPYLWAKCLALCVWALP